MVALENPEDNPCFGCGPHHARGLHLQFERLEGGEGVPEIVTRFTPGDDEIGWPTLFHHGLHFTVLYEASYWAALTLGGRLWVSHGPIEYDAQRLPRTGIRHIARARLTAKEPESLQIRADSATESGKPCGSLVSHWIPARRDSIERAGVPLPDYLVGEIRP